MSPLVSIQRPVAQIQESVYYMQQALGRIENRQCSLELIGELKDSEFKVSSQWGEDGIIQFLLKSLPIERKIFVEFGVQDYRESNTRFLLTNNNWSGLILDGSKGDIKFVKSDPIYWRYNLKAVHAFVTSENINDLLLDNGIEGEIGLLSVDIDRNDYWVWQAINVVKPAIVVSKYNFRFGPNKAVTTPYAPGFVRSEAHHSMIYYGASLKALCLLAGQKGYAFVGCNSAGNNAFFVRRDLRPAHMPELTSEAGYVADQFRESRNKDGQLTFLSNEEELKILNSLPLIEVE
jgi:hypothetical protein